jgi:DcmR-like sensory protein
LFNQTERQDSAKSEHVVQLFDTPDSLGQSVAAFLRDGLADGDALLVVARGIHLQAIAGALTRQGVPIRQLIDNGQLTMLDAVALLRQFLVYGMPDAERFDHVIGDLVRTVVSERGRVRIYGEMVDLLAEQMEFGAVITLEQLWNELSRTTSFTLLCGYASAHFAPIAASGLLRDVCSCHDRVVQDQSDLLGSWVLAQSAAVS